MAVRSCAQKIAERPDLASAQDIESLSNILADSTHSEQTCAHFLYQEAAIALSRCISHNRTSELCSRAWHILDNFTGRAAGSAGLAAAQALGSLPLTIDPPQPCISDLDSSPPVKLSTLFSRAGLKNPQCTSAGRSLLFFDQESPDQVLALKGAENKEQVLGLAHESWWMNYLFQNPHLLPGQHIPTPLSKPCKINLQASHSLPATPRTPPETVWLPYQTRPEYFSYALDPNPGCKLSDEDFHLVLAQAAFGLGSLSRHGLMHKAPVPLFHNRAQSSRRDDQGLYIWTRGGRLDRWFASCLYPNFGLSGLRDFEHLEPWSGYPRHLFRELGTQIMSLVLAIGGWFRLKDPQLMGLTSQGEPVDARHLFDHSLFVHFLKTVVREFSSGFQGKALNSDKIRYETCVDQLIEALGVDRHMTEVLRTQDQLGYDPKSFRALLGAKALDPEGVECLLPGEHDVTLITGPHLGEFNSRISVPELTSFTASVSGLCIAQAYFQDLPPA